MALSTISKYLGSNILRGSCERGRSSAPFNGNIEILLGISSIFLYLYKLLILAK